MAQKPDGKQIASVENNGKVSKLSSDKIDCIKESKSFNCECDTTKNYKVTGEGKNRAIFCRGCSSTCKDQDAIDL